MADVPGVTVIEPESERYRADLVFLHGLWADAAIWRAAAAGFAHRGWRCVLVDAPADTASHGLAPSFESALRAVPGRETKPIVIGHDAGALVALDLAARGLVRGAVAVAPLVEGLAHLLPRRQRALLPLRRWGAVPPPPAEHPYFMGIPPAARDELRARLVAEPVARLRELERLTEPAAPAVPAVLVAQQADAVATTLFIEVCARGIEADFQRASGGHWPMLEERVDDWITQIHRWIIKRVGHGLLMLRGDEDLRDG
jgi:pimeloyl-ACP methyl ester carboxylesterase